MKEKRKQKIFAKFKRVLLWEELRGERVELEIGAFWPDSYLRVRETGSLLEDFEDWFFVFISVSMKGNFFLLKEKWVF